ncbi:hypothetical protein F4677DRAFT_420781 [Hypoxylon crocopeplum]|nr:hypothetical protein F4677DRAFT_420781 [Hypoxylon crocopeplum]
MCRSLAPRLTRGSSSARESADVVRILLLLAIYSLADPHRYSTWSLVDIAVRMTMRLGLDRRDVADEGLLPSEAEQQHRLFGASMSLTGWRPHQSESAPQ